MIILATLSLLTFLISIPIGEFNVAKYIFQGISATLLIGAIAVALT